MIVAIRTLMALSLVLLLAAALLPFEQPLKVDIPLDQPPPGWLLAAALLPAAWVAGLVACVGLLRFRRWGRLFALAASVLALLAVSAQAQSPLPGKMGSPGIVLLATGGLAWICAVLLCYHPRLRSRFRA